MLLHFLPSSGVTEWVGLQQTRCGKDLIKVAGYALDADGVGLVCLANLGDRSAWHISCSGRVSGDMMMICVVTSLSQSVFQIDFCMQFIDFTRDCFVTKQLKCSLGVHVCMCMCGFSVA